MSEPFTTRQQPRTPAPLTDLTLIVRPHNSTAVRAYTTTERAEAEAYAREWGTTIQQLP